MTISQCESCKHRPCVCVSDGVISSLKATLESYGRQVARLKTDLRAARGANAALRGQLDQEPAARDGHVTRIEELHQLLEAERRTSNVLAKKATEYEALAETNAELHWQKHHQRDRARKWAAAWRLSAKNWKANYRLEHAERDELHEQLRRSATVCPKDGCMLWLGHKEEHATKEQVAAALAGSDELRSQAAEFRETLERMKGDHDAMCIGKRLLRCEGEPPIPCTCRARFRDERIDAALNARRAEGGSDE